MSESPRRLALQPDKPIGLRNELGSTERHTDRTNYTGGVPPTVEITVVTAGGERLPACTIEQAARDRGMGYDSLRKAVARAGVQAIPDAKVGNSELYAIADITAALDRRPGRGAPGVPRPHRPGNDSAAE
jgi:hypothetical protein